MITALSNKLNANFWVVFFLILTSLSACKNTEKTTAQPAKGGLSYQMGDQERIAFNENYFNGLSAKYSGDFARAKVYFEQCLKLQPNSNTVKFELAQCQEGLVNMQSAMALAKEVSENDPENRWFKVYLAELYKKNSRYPEAIATYEELIATYPKELNFYYELGNLYLFSNYIQKAINTYEGLEKQTGFSPELSEQLVKLYINEGQTEKATAELQKLLDADPSELKYYSLLAEIYREQGEMNKAIDLFEKLKTEHPDDPFVYLTLYDYYNMVNQKDKALDNLREAFSSPQMNIDSEISIMMNYFAASEQDTALKRFAYELLQLMVETHPNEAKAWAMYGDYLNRDHKMKEAREMYLKAIALDESVWAIWNQLLFIDSELTDNAALKKHSAQAMELFPSQALVFFFNGIAHLQDKEYKEAQSSLETASQLAMGNIQLEMQIYASLGDAAYQNGDIQKAWKSYERALKINPANDYVLNNYAYFLSLRKENLTMAEEMSAATVKRNPNSATYLDTYGWVLYQMGKYSEAKEVIGKALRHGGDASGEVLEHYGDILYRLGEKENALDYWKQALKTGPETEALKQKIEVKKLVD